MHYNLNIIFGESVGKHNSSSMTFKNSQQLVGRVFIYNVKLCCQNNSNKNRERESENERARERERGEEVKETRRLLNHKIHENL